MHVASTFKEVEQFEELVGPLQAKGWCPGIRGVPLASTALLWVYLGVE